MIESKDKKPPCWVLVSTYYPQALRGPITYGTSIFAPKGFYMDTPRIIHEYYHMAQQKVYGSPQKWWERYVKDPGFRLQQELPAYQIQYRDISHHIHDRNRLYNIAHSFAKELVTLSDNKIGLNEAINYVKSDKLVNVSIGTSDKFLDKRRGTLRDWKYKEDQKIGTPDDKPIDDLVKRYAEDAQEKKAKRIIHLDTNVKGALQA